MFISTYYFHLFIYWFIFILPLLILFGYIIVSCYYSVSSYIFFVHGYMKSSQIQNLYWQPTEEVTDKTNHEVAHTVQP